MSKELEQANLFIDPGEFESLKSPRDGFDDPNGAFPKARSIGLTGVNPRATGAETGGVYLGGGSKGVGWELAEEVGAEYPLCQVKETSAGHIQEFDDTYGRERIMLRHKTGAGVEMFADGTVAISSTKNCIRTVVGDEKVKIEGDAELIYGGNVTMRVAGDFNLDIGGNFKTFVGGDILSETRGSFLQDVEKMQI